MSTNKPQSVQQPRNKTHDTQNKQSDIRVNSITIEQASCFLFFPTRIETSGMHKYLCRTNIEQGF